MKASTKLYRAASLNHKDSAKRAEALKLARSAVRDLEQMTIEAGEALILEPTKE